MSSEPYRNDRLYFTEVFKEVTAWLFMIERVTSYMNGRRKILRNVGCIGHNYVLLQSAFSTVNVDRYVGRVAIQTCTYFHDINCIGL
jgi:hypothetical protein